MPSTQKAVPAPRAAASRRAVRQRGLPGDDQGSAVPVPGPAEDLLDRPEVAFAPVQLFVRHAGPS
ncbi:hypothetical protein ACFQY7_31225 [Actinomadura luteofluorescens]|uniref:hypothetical protein n=1 Tax=Actinomadura luteofluorescens TaxID=46163 RepID=UPI003645B9A5